MLGGAYKKDYSTLGSILGSPYFGKLTYIPQNWRLLCMVPDQPNGMRWAASAKIALNIL